ncbi:unnamed protein product [Boreogadus saida]
MDWGRARGDRLARELAWGRAVGCQVGGQKNAPGHGRELQADSLGGKQRPAAAKTKTRSSEGPFWKVWKAEPLGKARLSCNLKDQGTSHEGQPGIKRNKAVDSSRQ